MEEIGVLGIAGGVILGILGVPVVAGVVKGIIGAIQSGCEEAADAIAKKASDKLRTKARAAFNDPEKIKNLIVSHQEDFEGLSQYACGKVFEKIFQEEYPEDYELICKAFGQTARNDAFKNQFKDHKGQSDKDKLAAAKEKYGIKF